MKTMEIIPKVNDRVIYTENDQRIAICAYLRKACEVETSKVLDLSKKDKEKVFDAYVLFDFNTSKIIEKFNVFIEDYPTIAYVRMKNMSDQDGDQFELCHYIPEVPIDPIPTCWWKTHKNLLYIVLSIFVIIAILFAVKELWPSRPSLEKLDEKVDTIPLGVQETSETIPAIEVCNNLADKGYLTISVPKNVLAKMYVSPDLNANGKSIDWNKVSDFITSNDTLFPKRDCKIFIHVYSKNTTDLTFTDTSFVFNMKEFVQYVVLEFAKDKELGNVTRKMLYNVSEERPIIFDVGGGIEPIVITSIYDLKQIPDYISQDLESFKIDSVDFYPYPKSIKGPTIFSNEYPSLKYLRLK